MSAPEFMYRLAAGLLLVAALGLILWQRSRLLQLRELLGQVRLELEGANNRLAQTKSQAALQSRTDPVTGLLVRHAVVERFQFALALARRGNLILGVVLIQLADLSRLTNGHKETEDLLLMALSARLLAVVRDADMVGRMQDHEFAVLSSVLKSADDIQLVVAKLRAALDPPFVLPGVEQTFRLKAYFGSSTYPRDGESWASVMKAADESLRLSRMMAQH